MPRPCHRPITLALGLALAWTTPSHADMAGPYLAARQADADHDFAAAAEWYGKALTADPQNLDLLERAITNDMALGAIDKAATAGEMLLKSGVKNQIAYLAVLTADIRSENYAKVIADQKAGNSIGALVDHLVTAWAEVGSGNMSQAQTDFDSIIKDPGTKKEQQPRYLRAFDFLSKGPEKDKALQDLLGLE